MSYHNIINLSVNNYSFPMSIFQSCQHAFIYRLQMVNLGNRSWLCVICCRIMKIWKHMYYWIYFFISSYICWFLLFLTFSSIFIKSMFICTLILYLMHKIVNEEIHFQTFESNPYYLCEHVSFSKNTKMIFLQLQILYCMITFFLSRLFPLTFCKVSY